MKLSGNKIDVVKREQGDWVDNIPELQGVRVKVRGMGNKDWARMEARLVNAVPRARRLRGLEPEDRDRINGILLRDTSLLDWEGIEGDDDKSIPYSKQQANEFLTNPEYGKFRDGVLWAASVVAEQTAAEIEEDAGN